MAKNELKNLRRVDLLEMVLELRRENERLQEENRQLQYKLVDRVIMLNKTGNIAEAAMQLNGVFQAAQAACEQYEQSVRARCERLEQATMEKCRAMLQEEKSRIKEHEAKEKRDSAD